MSDVGIAPAPAAPAAPASNEVVINPNPTHAPAPLGPQAPNKAVEPEGSTHRPESRRESIKRAFERADKAEPAKPRMGHNNPPEAMEREKQPPTARQAREAREKPEPVDLKKRPADQPRDQGRFVARAHEGQEGAARQAQPTQHKQLPEGTPYRDPPQRMSERARADWHAAPESVRGEVHRMHQEFGRAYQQYRGDHDEMNAIRPFHQMARQHGTTLHRALSNYVGMEEKLRNDVVGGLDVIVNNLNLRAEGGQRLTLRDVAWHIVNQSPEQQQLLRSQNTQMAQSHQLQAAHQRIQALEQHAQRMQHQQRFTYTRSGVDAFAEAHPRFDELGDLIENEVKLGFDLDTAYQRAELLRPASRAAQTRTNGTHAAQTRTPDRSIHGAPGGTGNGAARRSKEPVGRRDAIANAIKRVNGAT
jgi:hypothetical protein